MKRRLRMLTPGEGRDIAWALAPLLGLGIIVKKVVGNEPWEVADIGLVTMLLTIGTVGAAAHPRSSDDVVDHQPGGAARSNGDRGVERPREAGDGVDGGRLHRVRGWGRRHGLLGGQLHDVPLSAGGAQ